MNLVQTVWLNDKTSGLKNTGTVVVLLLWIMIAMSLVASAQQTVRAKTILPLIPVGYDAYRMWYRLPQQRIGVRAYMRSTYDRNGGGYDASHFLFMNKEDENVTLDVKGNGALYFFRTNHWHGSPWHFVVDGKDNIVKEAATENPVNADKNYKFTEFIPPAAFPQPLAVTWAVTKGSDLSWVPMPFKNDFQIAYSRTFYGTGYYIYHLFANQEQLSQRPNAWDINKTADQDVVTFLNRAGTDIAPKNISKKTGSVKLDKSQILIATLNTKSSVLRALKLTLPLDAAEEIEKMRLRITWDGAKYPSVDAPISLFFGSGTFFNREKKEYLVKGLPINVRYDYPHNKIELACYYPMPFFRSAKIELVNAPVNQAEIKYELRYEPLTTSPRLNSYFHATYRDMPKPELGKDMVWLDTRGVEGHQDWSGSFVGTSFIFSHNANLYTLEGDPRFFFDDSQTPQAYGTGTEEWAGGGDYWGGENMTLALAGHPCGSTEKKTAVNDKDLLQSAYRFLVADLMPFGKRAVIRFEHSENVSQEHYEAVSYWYGLPAASLIKTDSVDIGNTGDEKRHSYVSPQATAPESITSRYEWGADKFPKGAWGIDLQKIEGYDEIKNKELYPAQTLDGRHTTGTSEFTVQLRSDNLGALIRRTLDYGYPNQTAEVYVAPVINGKTQEDKWSKAGTWYLAGANSCMVSRPEGELGKRRYDIQTSNRRLRDDEFLIPAELTKGCQAIRIRIKFVPSSQELYPGKPFPEKSAWSELAYTVYSYVLPDFSIKNLLK